MFEIPKYALLDEKLSINYVHIKHPVIVSNPLDLIFAYNHDPLSVSSYFTIAQYIFSEHIFSLFYTWHIFHAYGRFQIKFTILKFYINFISSRKAHVRKELGKIVK